MVLHIIGIDSGTELFRGEPLGFFLVGCLKGEDAGTQRLAAIFDREYLFMWFCHVLKSTTA